MSAIEESVIKKLKKPKAKVRAASKKNTPKKSNDINTKDLSEINNVEQIDNSHRDTSTIDSTNNNFDEPLENPPLELSNLKTENLLTDEERNPDYFQRMKNRKDICLAPNNDANKVGAITKSTEEMGMDASIDLKNTFVSFSQDEQKAAIAHVQSLKGRLIPSGLEEQLKTEYISASEDTKIPADNPFTRLKCSFKKYVETVVRPKFKQLRQSEKEEILDYIDDLAKEFNRKIEKNRYIPPTLPKNEEEMEAIGIKLYSDVYPSNSRVTDEQLIKHTKENWGAWLVSVHPELKIDSITRIQLGEYDKKLLSKLKGLSTEKLSTLIQTEHKQKQISRKRPLTKEDMKEAGRINSEKQRDNKRKLLAESEPA